ncbi:MAG: prepilin-type N-terminal cleavage/methylation domain-containing protein [Candidatus Taylorbacteria bacterium]|nr:prepilin-type N-terminal cleavage/methylation domain-containing protein [Candidatus Taylorbacteria bacterium]
MKKILKSKYNTGFTLIELLVTIVIFVILTGVVLFNQKGFDNTVLLNNLTYDIALTIRQAQTFGVNTRESASSTSISGYVFPPYGIFLNIDNADGGNNKNIILFSDTTPNSTFNDEISLSCPANDAECVQKYSIKRGSYIKQICVPSGVSEDCDVKRLTIMFKRPKPDALIYKGNEKNTPLGQAEIIISSADGSAESSVVVTNIGQIYVQK